VSVAPRPASTVALLRDRERPEVFLVRRHDNAAFMPGTHVFPGGSVDRGDHLDDHEPRCDGVASATARMPDVPAGAAVAFHVAAIRELFEEAGVLLARRDGVLLSRVTHTRSDLLACRRQLAAGGMTIGALASRESLRLAVDQLVYVGHWVTPDGEARRFDTRFFLALAPPDQQASHDAGETTQGKWMTAAQAIARCRRGEIALPPPTWTTLRWLERFGSAAEAIASARSRPVPRVQPVLMRRGNTRLVLLPGDPDCPPVDGFDAEECRFVLEDGRWRPIPPGG
jgi:8-oxo-dGTP pyrophosphatase MutT (NUDIX family)